ncbi:hypothetical protein BGP_5468 [Beggiatoa sp. PS]|nr:hypothetical protein BGP_5468 [Beggiatoa sp. PS]
MTMENLNHPKPRILISENDLGLTGIPAKNLENVRLALTRLLKNNPQVFTVNSPEEALAILGVTSNVPQKTGKWAAAAKRLSTQNTLSQEAGKELQKAILDFRETFAIGDTLNEPKT